MNKKRILYIAYGCEPYSGSEQGVGWNWAIGLSKIADVTILTRANNEKVINEWLELNESNIEFIYYDLEDWQKSFKKRDKGVYLYYYMWRYGVHKKCKGMDLSQYDLIWDTNFGNVFLPTYIFKYKLTSVSGPIGFGIGVNRQFSKRYSCSERVKHMAKRLFLNSSSSINILARKVFKSDKIICSAPWLYNDMSYKIKKKAKLVLYNAISIDEIDDIQIDKINVDQENLNILCIGRMVSIKEFEIAINAIISIKKHADIILHIIGWGEEEIKLKLLVKEKNMGENIIFYGKQSRQRVISFLKQSDILIMPSVSEGLSTMAMEAMACKCMPLLMDIPAHTLLADNNCSIKVKADTPEEAVKGFAEAILKCYNNNKLLEELSLNARERAEQYFDWSCRDKDYEEVLDFCLEGKR